MHFSFAHSSSIEIEYPKSQTRRNKFVQNCHITNYEGLNYLLGLLNINDNSAENENFDRKTFGIIIVKENICAIDKAR